MSISRSNKPNISRILGIDYGKSKVGLAMADSETRIAFAYATLDNDKNLLQKLAEIIERENVSKVIIGIPSLSLRAKRSNPVDNRIASGLLRRFTPRNDKMTLPGLSGIVNFLKEKLNVKVEYQEEMFTTREAQRNLIEKGVKGIKRYDDQEAARLILQGWLDRIT